MKTKRPDYSSHSHVIGVEQRGSAPSTTVRDVEQRASAPASGGTRAPHLQRIIAILDDPEEQFQLNLVAGRRQTPTPHDVYVDAAYFMVKYEFLTHAGQARIRAQLVQSGVPRHVIDAEYLMDFVLDCNAEYEDRFRAMCAWIIEDEIRQERAVAEAKALQELRGRERVRELELARAAALKAQLDDVCSFRFHAKDVLPAVLQEEVLSNAELESFNDDFEFARLRSPDWFDAGHIENALDDLKDHRPGISAGRVQEVRDALRALSARLCYDGPYEVLRTEMELHRPPDPDVNAVKALKCSLRRLRRVIRERDALKSQLKTLLGGDPPDPTHVGDGGREPPDVLSDSALVAPAPSVYEWVGLPDPPNECHPAIDGEEPPKRSFLDAEVGKAASYLRPAHTCVEPRREKRPKNLLSGDISDAWVFNPSSERLIFPRRMHEPPLRVALRMRRGKSSFAPAPPFDNGSGA